MGETLTPECAGLWWFVLLGFFSLIQLTNGSNKFPPAKIKEHPSNKTVSVDIGQFNLTCSGCAENIFFSVNGVNANNVDIKHFYQYPVVFENVSNPCHIRRSLLVQVSLSVNNSVITCTVYNTENNPSGEVSDPALIFVEDAPGKPLNVRHNMNYTTNILEMYWDPPPTKYNTQIGRYDILSNVTDFNGTSTSNTSITFNISSPELYCQGIALNVSANNGLIGKPANSLVHVYSAPITVIPVKVNVLGYDNVTEEFKLKLLIDVSNICYGQLPTSFSYSISGENCSASSPIIASTKRINVSNEHLFNLSYIALTNHQRYCVNVSFGNSIAEDFGNISKTFFDVELPLVNTLDYLNETNGTNTTKRFNINLTSNGCSENFMTHFWITFPVLLVNMIFNLCA